MNKGVGEVGEGLKPSIDLLEGGVVVTPHTTVNGRGEVIATTGDIHEASFAEGGDAIEAMVNSTGADAIAVIEAPTEPLVVQPSGKGARTPRLSHSPSHDLFLKEALRTGYENMQALFKNREWKITMPPIEDVWKTIERKGYFSPEQIEAAIQDMRYPELIAIPGEMTFGQKIALLEGSRGGNPRVNVDLCTLNILQDQLERAKDIKKPAWEFLVADRAGSDMGYKAILLPEALKRMRSEANGLLRPPTPSEYLILQSLGDPNGKPLDRGGMSLLSNEISPDNVLVGQHKTFVILGTAKRSPAEDSPNPLICVDLVAVHIGAKNPIGIRRVMAPLNQK